MSQRLNDYFVREAGEYLEQLARLLSSRNQRPDSEQLVRLTRGIRGSAQMAGAGGLAPLSERLEIAARSYHGQSVQWSDRLRQLFTDSANELRTLLGAGSEWSDEERARVRLLLARWDSGDREANDDPSSGDDEITVVPISSLFFDDAGPHVITAPRDRGSLAGSDQAQTTDDAVPIESLLLRGPAAARAAISLRPKLNQLLAHGAPASDLAPLHNEIFDLLELSISEASA
ncbi:hypothetical protein BH23GEM6_BH23GEM6_17490 [soil metagenome]